MLRAQIRLATNSGLEGLGSFFRAVLNAFRNECLGAAGCGVRGRARNLRNLVGRLSDAIMISMARYLRV